MPTLKVLMIGKNKLHGGICNLECLPKLDVVDAHSNELESIELRNAGVRILNLAANKFSETFFFTEPPKPFKNLIELNLRKKHQKHIVIGLRSRHDLRFFFLT